MWCRSRCEPILLTRTTAYNELVSCKVQITLPENLAAELKREAARRETSLSEFIRETLREKLANGAPNAHEHPFASIIGILEDGEPDLAARVDEILYR